MVRITSFARECLQRFREELDSCTNEGRQVRGWLTGFEHDRNLILSVIAARTNSAKASPFLRDLDPKLLPLERWTRSTLPAGVRIVGAFVVVPATEHSLGLEAAQSVHAWFEERIENVQKGSGVAESVFLCVCGDKVQAFRSKETGNGKSSAALDPAIQPTSTVNGEEFESYIREQNILPIQCKAEVTIFEDSSFDPAQNEIDESAFRSRICGRKTHFANPTSLYFRLPGNSFAVFSETCEDSIGKLFADARSQEALVGADTGTEDEYPSRSTGTKVKSQKKGKKGKKGGPAAQTVANFLDSEWTPTRKSAEKVEQVFTTNSLCDAERVKSLELLTDISVVKNQCVAPAVHLGHVGEDTPVRFRISLDTLAFCPYETGAKHIIARIRAKLEEQLEYALLLSSNFVRSSGLHVAQDNKNLQVEASFWHCSVDQSSIPITVSYPVFGGCKTEYADCLKQERRWIHEQYGLPLFRPLLRRRDSILNEGKLKAQTLLLDGQPDCSLRNVHGGLGDPGVNGGQQYIVKGDYRYYHYLQNGINDKGWGCAYRSLQTIVSWFQLNGFTEERVPTHAEIQSLLVRIGDKPASFAGSREWIGSMEVGFWLGEVLGVDWKNIMVNSGPEVAEKGRELAKHFMENGTPVMMGGGALALTILGIDYNAATGDIAFLILDPHYTGKDDWSSIRKVHQMEGYRAMPCEWRRADSFSKSTFYSLCLPQKPNVI